MPTNPPLLASGSRDLKRPRPIPKQVRDAIKLMVWGKLDDPDCSPVGFIEAAKIVDIKPDVMRRYLDRSDVRGLLLGERRAFRAAVCSSNELALRRVRDTSPNGMATVAAVRALEELDTEQSARHSNGQATVPGLCIVIAVPPLPPPNDPASNSLTIINVDPLPPGQGGPALAGD